MVQEVCEPTNANTAGLNERGVTPQEWPSKYFGVTVGKKSRLRRAPLLPIVLKRVNAEKYISALIGKAHRNFVTGAVWLKRVQDFPDFSFADLWTRESLYGSREQYVADKYLFRVVVLAYRTWIYHVLFRTRELVYTDIGDPSLLRALSEPCIDAPVRAGRWSPLVLYVPSALSAALTRDMVAVLLSMLAMAVLFYAAKTSNYPESYRYGRVLTLPYRAAHLVLLVLRLRAMPDGSTTLQVLSFLFSITLVIADLLVGDGSELMCYRFLCTYEIIRELPNRVFVCKRHGAAHSEEAFGDRGVVHECVSGFAEWDHTYALIADIQGLLVELRPPKVHELDQLVREYNLDNQQPRRFVGLDVFNGLERV